MKAILMLSRVVDTMYDLSFVLPFQLFLLANIIMLSTDNVIVRDYEKVTEIQVI